MYKQKQHPKSLATPSPPIFVVGVSFLNYEMNLGPCPPVTFNDSNSAQAKPLKRVNSAAYLGGGIPISVFLVGSFQKEKITLGYWGYRDICVRLSFYMF